MTDDNRSCSVVHFVKLIRMVNHQAQAPISSELLSNPLLESLSKFLITLGIAAATCAWVLHQLVELRRSVGAYESLSQILFARTTKQYATVFYHRTLEEQTGSSDEHNISQYCSSEWQDFVEKLQIFLECQSDKECFEKIAEYDDVDCDEFDFDESGNISFEANELSHEPSKLMKQPDIVSLEYAFDVARRRAALSQTLSLYHPPHIDARLFLTPKLLGATPKMEWRNTLFPDLTIAGLPKAGTSQLSFILRSHPQAVPFSDHTEECFRQKFDIDHAAKSFTKKNSSALQKNLFYYFNRHPKHTDSSKQKLMTVNSCHNPDDIILRAHYLKPTKKQRILYLIRDPADWLWAIWNFWVDTDMDVSVVGSESVPGRGMIRAWAQDGVDYRSPELFHEFMVAGDRLVPSARLINSRERTVTDLRKLIAAFGRDNVFVARTQDMLPQSIDESGGFLDRLSEFTGLPRDGFLDNATKVIHNCNANKGNTASCGSAPSSAYGISGNRAMLNDTRKFVYLYFHEECKIWMKEFGAEFQDCLHILS